MEKPQAQKKTAGSPGSPTFKILFGLAVAVALAGLIGIFVRPGKVKPVPEENLKSSQPQPSGPRYHYQDWPGDRGYGGGTGRPQSPGGGGTPAPGARTSQQINPKEDPEGFIRARFEESPWLWEKASPEDKEKIFEQFRERMLRLQEMGKDNSTGTGMGMGKKIHAQRWAGREKRGGRHGRQRQDSGAPVINNMSGENQGRGAEGRSGPGPETGGKQNR